MTSSPRCMGKRKTVSSLACQHNMVGSEMVSLPLGDVLPADLAKRRQAGTGSPFLSGG